MGGNGAGDGGAHGHQRLPKPPAIEKPSTNVAAASAALPHALRPGLDRS